MVQYLLEIFSSAGLIEGSSEYIHLQDYEKV